MPSLNGLLNRLFRKRAAASPDLTELLGFVPRDEAIFRTALRHSSYTRKYKEEQVPSNERLEFLGDAVLQLVTSEILYEEFPEKNEGALTSLRTKLVNRPVLNRSAVKLGLPALIQQRVGRTKALKEKTHSIYGNALEALIGAIYLDQGINRAKEFYLAKVLEIEHGLRELDRKVIDHKSLLVTWAQREGKSIVFQDEAFEGKEGQLFKSTVQLEGDDLSTGSGRKKKEAHQEASREAIEVLESRGYSLSNGKG